MVRETWVLPQVESYKRLKNGTWYLSNIRYVSRVKWSNPGKGEAPSPTPWCSSYWKGSLLVTLDYSHQLYFYFIKKADLIKKFSTGPLSKKKFSLDSSSVSWGFRIYWLCGVSTEGQGQGQMAKLYSCLISYSIIRLFYFTPCWLVGVKPCPRKAQKELYKRRQ